VDPHELTVIRTDDTERTFRGGFRELALLRARLEMAREAGEVGILVHDLSTGRVSVRIDRLREIGRVVPA